MLFKSTKDILKGEGEVLDPNWMDSDKVINPPNPKWDYTRELKIEDVDIWEVLHESGRGGVYAAWCPYAEFYMHVFRGQIETFYGKGAQKRLKEHVAQYGITLYEVEHWIEPEDMWLFTK